MLWTLILALQLITSLGVCEYEVPVANVTVLNPTGFTVSIPDDGLQLFAFHGKINEPLAHLEAGTFSKDITRAKNGLWTFKERQTKLKPGDILNYWTFVIKNGLGYRKDAQQFIVPDGVNTNTVANGPVPGANVPLVTTEKDGCTKEELNNVVSQLNGTLDKYQRYFEKTQYYQSMLKSLEEVIADMQNGTDVGTKLILLGNLPADVNAVEMIRSVLSEKLELFDIAKTTFTATRTRSGIVFDVDSALDKARVLVRAKNRLKNSKTQIIDYIFNTADGMGDINVSLDSRISEDDDTT